MISKEKALYQVKVILDYLPEEEYNLIPKETIDYIENNLEYDENFTINPDIPLDEQNVDYKAFDELEKIVKQVESAKLREKMNIKNENKQEINENNQEINEYVKYAKKSNEIYNDKIENIRLKNIIESLKKENEKIPQVKKLLEDYKKELNRKNEEIKQLKDSNQDLFDSIKRIPKFIRKIFIKDYEKKLLKERW